MLITILLFPLFSAISSGLFGRFLGKSANVLSCFLIFLCFCCSASFFFSETINIVSCSFNLFSWIKLGDFSVNWGFLFDGVTSVILIVVTFVSFLVHIYSSSYISEDPHQPRFIAYLSLFTFFILILVTADNFVQIFVGWEGVGLCSYLLINFWFTRIQANKAAIKAILVNRVGDFGLCLGLFCIFIETGSLDYGVVFSIVPFLTESFINFIGFNFYFLDLACFLLFVGSIGKSAQLGLHTWLPDAIEGPTPVSALIHAATMVTAGVFLLIRCSILFEYAENTLWFITLLGGLTSFFAASVGIVQNDLKKVIAYSTCSQLGYIIFACGLSGYKVGLFHLANHAFFKALLFLGAGSVIHALSDEQDIRRIGGLVRLLPFTYSIILIGSLALAGFPFLSGFYSKDFILELAFSHYSSKGFYVYCLGTISAFLTAFYSIRLLYITFLGKPLGYKKHYEKVHEAPFFIAFPLICLAVGSIGFGFFFKDAFIGYGSDFFTHSIFTKPSHFSLSEAEFIPWFFKQLPFIFASCGLSGSFLSYALYSEKLFKFKIFKKKGFYAYTFFNKKWFFDKIYNENISQPFVCLSYKSTYKTIDKGFLELFGPFGLSLGFYKSLKENKKIYSGYLFHYTLVILVALIAGIFIFIFQIFLCNVDFRIFIIFICFLF